MVKKVREDRVQVTFRITAEQYDALGGNALKKLNRALEMYDELPRGNYTATNLEDSASKWIGGHLRTDNHAKLKTLAETSGLSMSKTAIRLLQLPE